MNQELRYSLGVVQTHATQFDGPFFRFLARDSRFNLTVYYTRGDGARTSIDPELGRKEAWDHDVTSGYQYLVRANGPIGLVHLLLRAMRAHHDLLIVSGYASMAHLLLVMACKLRGIRVGIRSDTTLLLRKRSPIKSRLKNIILPGVLRLFDIGLPTGTLAGEYLVHYGMSKSVLFPFPYNSDNDYLAMMSAQAKTHMESFRQKMGIFSDAFVILGILKLIPREDPLTLLRAFFLVQNDLPSAHLLIVGDGNLRREIEEEVKRQHLQNVHVLGYMPYSQLPLYYAMADVFVHPAQMEPWGVSVIEAMACGLPVVASDGVGVVRDLVVPEETGFIFQAGGAEELAKYLKQIGKNPDLRKVMSNNAKNIINHKWQYRTMAENLWEAVRYLQFR